MRGIGVQGLRMLRSLASYCDEVGYPPSHRELQERTGLASVSQVNYWLDSLENYGLVRRKRKRARTVVVTREGRQWIARDWTPQAQQGE